MKHGAAVDVHQLQPGHLDRVAVVAQCLDNQWVPRSLLQTMHDRGLSLTDVRHERVALVRAEYLRSLLTARQVVVNRAYLYNNSAVYGDFERKPSRAAAVELLRDGSLIPYLYDENHPMERPAVQVDDRGFRAWQQVCRESERLSCLRLDWDDDQNRKGTRNLAALFHSFITSAAERAGNGGASVFARHLGLPSARGDELLAVFRQLRDWADAVNDRDGTFVTRNQVYERFVVPPGAAVTDGRCDPAKPLSMQVKQLVDLQYNTSLPEFLDRLPLRPADTLHRAALREPVPPRRGSSSADPARLEQALQARLAFDSLSEEMTPIATPYLMDLSMPAIVRVRGTDEWRTYIDQLTELMRADEAEAFETHGQHLLESYSAVLRRLGERCGHLHLWQPRRQVVLEVAGVELRVTHGRRPTFQRSGRVEGGSSRSMATVRFLLVNRHGEPAAGTQEADLAVDTLRAPVDDPAGYVDQIAERLRREKFEELPAADVSERRRPAGIEKDLLGGAAT